VSELERLRWRVSELEDSLYYELKRKERELRSQIEDVRENFVDWSEFNEWCSRVERLEARLAEVENLVRKLERRAGE
jgi:polyhydroxyalkanoate synthesis regulator phasin